MPPQGALLRGALMVLNCLVHPLRGTKLHFGIPAPRLEMAVLKVGTAALACSLASHYRWLIITDPDAN